MKRFKISGWIFLHVGLRNVKSKARKNYVERTFVRFTLRTISDFFKKKKKNL